MFEDDAKEVIMRKHDVEKMKENLIKNIESRWNPFFVVMTEYLEDLKRWKWGFSVKIKDYKIISNSRGWFETGFKIKYKWKKILELKKVCLTNSFKLVWFNEIYSDQIKELFQIIKVELEHKIKQKEVQIDKESAFFELVRFD